MILAFRPAAKSDKRRKRLAEFAGQIASTQRDNGSWKPGGQLPSQKRTKGETTQVSAIWNTAALVTENAKPSARDKALKFLAKAQPGKSSEWLVASLLLEHRRGEKQAVALRRKQLLATQRPDGGWGWLTAEKSDALATGMSLYALVNTGTPGSDPAIRKAIAFLLKTQQANGTYRVHGTKANKRNKPQETANYWGTAWATIGLLETLPITKR